MLADQYYFIFKSRNVLGRLLFQGFVILVHITVKHYRRLPHKTITKLFGLQNGTETILAGANNRSMWKTGYLNFRSMFWGITHLRITGEIFENTKTVLA